MADEWGGNLDEVDGDELQSGGLIELEGDYHLECERVEGVRDEQTEIPKSIKFVFVCLHTGTLQGKKQSAEGSRFVHFMSLSDNSLASKVAGQARATFGLGLGVLKKVTVDGVGSRIVDSVTGKSPNLATWERAVGVQVIAPLRRQKEYQGERRIDVNFGAVFHVHDPRVADTPRNVEMAGLVAVPPEFSGQAAAATTKTTPPAATPQKAAAPASKGGDEFGDL